VSQYVPDEQLLTLDPRYQSVAIAPDVEHRASTYHVSRREQQSNVGDACPVRLLCELVPGIERASQISMLLSCVNELPSANDPHLRLHRLGRFAHCEVLPRAEHINSPIAKIAAQIFALCEAVVN
jgi:hypothetical protein